MGRLKTYLWRYWRRYLVGGICLLSPAPLVMWIPWWIRDAVRIIENGGSLRDVRFYAAVIGAAALLQGVVRTCSRALIFNAGRDVEYDLRNDLFAHLQKLPLSFYHSQRTGDLMSRVINDISAVRVMLGPGILNFVNAPVYLVYALVLMLSMDVRMTLAALAPFPLLIIAVAKFRGRILKSSLEVQQQMSALSSHVQENLSGMHVVKAYTQEAFQTRQFIGLNEAFQAKSLELARMRGIITPVMQGFNALTVLIVLWYGGVRVIRGDLLVADIVAFVAYLNVLAWPTAAFGWMLSLVERGRAAMKRLEEILKTEPEIASPSTSLPVRGLKQGIEFRDVSFVYGRQHSKISIFHCPLVGQSGWWAGSVRERARWRSWCRASSMYRPAKFSWTAKIFESSPSASCAGLSVVSPRTHFSFRRPCGAIWPLAGTKSRMRKWHGRWGSPGWIVIWRSFRRE